MKEEHQKKRERINLLQSSVKHTLITGKCIEEVLSSAESSLTNYLMSEFVGEGCVVSDIHRAEIEEKMKEFSEVLFWHLRKKGTEYINCSVVDFVQLVDDFTNKGERE